MGFIDQIFSLVWDVSDLFYNAYIEVKSWIWPFSYLQYPLYGLYIATWSLVSPIANFGAWVDYATGRIAEVLSIGAIQGYFQTWINYATGAWNWVANSFWNVWNIVDSWWSSMRFTVRAWVDESKTYALSLLGEVTTWVASLQELWDNLEAIIPSIGEVILWFRNWWGNVTSHLTTWWNERIGDIQNLINSAFLEREPFWAGWQDFRDRVVDFFTDPLEFMWARFTNWFLGPEV